MIRPTIIALLGMAAGAAAPALPVPPLPPAHPPTPQAAPVPNIDLRAPELAAVPRTAVGLRVFRMTDHGTGLGFIPGSAYETPEGRRPVQTPGFTVSVPVR